MKKRKNLDLFGNLLGFRGGVLELVDDPVQLVRLVLDRLHLLPDRVHLAFLVDLTL